MRQFPPSQKASDGQVAGTLARP